MTQRDRILSMLRAAGPAGVHSFVFFEERMPRAAAVVHTLRREGFEIESRPARHRGEAQGVLYVLREPAPTTPRSDAGLFAAAGARSAYDTSGDWA